MRPRTLSPFAAGLCYLLVVASARANDNDDLVRRVRDEHRVARESIRTFTATITVEETHPKQAVRAQGRYWRSGSTARTQEGREGGHTNDILMKGSEIRIVGRSWAPGKNAPTGVAIRQPANAFFGMCDAWREMKIESTGPDGGQLDLDRQLEGASGPIRADRDTLDGRQCVRLRYHEIYGGSSKASVVQWHDIGRNYLICKSTVEFPDDPSSHRSVAQVTDFIEPSPGVVFPVRVRRDHYKNGELFQASVSTLADVIINKPIPADVLALPALPPGTILTDRIENKQGPIGADWKPTGPMKPLAPVVPPAERAPPAAARPAPTETTQSTSEPTSSARWVTGGAVTVLLVTAGLVGIRRIRAGRPSRS